MLCFRDKTYCTSVGCIHFEKCSDACNELTIEAAIKWWGGDDAPIAVDNGCWTCYGEKGQKKIKLEGLE